MLSMNLIYPIQIPTNGQCRNKGSLMIIQVKTVFFLDNTEKFEKLKIIFFSVYALKKEWKS